MFFSERDGAGSFPAQGRPQAARSGEAKSARRLQTRRNGQGNQALGRRLRGRVRTSGHHAHSRARRASAGPRGKSPGCETIGRQALTGGFRASATLRARPGCGTLRAEAWGVAAMDLNSIERDFLTRLSLEPWTSPPVFDHRLLDRLVREKYVTSQAVALDAVYYEITDLGRASIVEAGG